MRRKPASNGRFIPPVLLLLATICIAAAAAPPQICRIHGGNTKTMWGTGFNLGQVTVFTWDAPFDEGKVIDALSAGDYNPATLLPSEPPDGAQTPEILGIGEQGRVMAAQFRPHYNAGGFFDARAGQSVCWVRNDDGFSAPHLVHPARPWWVYPGNATPGQRIRIFGRNIDARLVAVKHSETRAVTTLPDIGHGRHALYECSVRLPKDIAVGDYEIFVHNGSGGEAGWGGPLSLSVEARPQPPDTVLNVRDFGARGDGIHDDTQAIRQALLRAEAEGGGIVGCPPGLYAISAPLWVPSGVALRGTGPNSSILTVNDQNPMTFDVPAEIASAMPGHFRHRQESNNVGAMVWMRDRSRVTDIGLVDGPGVLQAIFGSHDDCQIERCTIRTTHSAQPAVMVEWGSYGFMVRDCTIESVSGAIFMTHGPHRQACIANNEIRALKPGTANNLFIRSFIDSVIENNVVSNGNRNWVSQLSYASCYHSILQGNVFTNNIPRRHNAGENMYESKSAAWHGSVHAAGPKAVTVSGTPFEPDKLRDMFVLIIDGCGLGQYRRVVSNTENKLTLATPWDIIPDASTHITVGYAYVETLWIDNTEEHTANWTGYWGNSFGNVIDGHINRDGAGLFLWAWQRNVPSPVAFCDIIGSRVTQRGTIQLRGPLVFGNTIRFSEVTGFRYRPGCHIQPTWLQGMDPQERTAIALGSADNNIEGLSESAPLKDWNIIEAAHIYDGPRGIYIADNADHNVLIRNAVHVDGEAVIDESDTTIRP